MSPLYRYRGRQVFLKGAALGTLCAVLSAGCSEVERRQDEQQSISSLTSDSKYPIPLSPSAKEEHRAMMLQHLEIIQVIMNALVEEDFELARGLTELHLGFFRHRKTMESERPENFPSAYQTLAMAHNAAAEKLARIIPTKDLKKILPQLNNVLKACVACHLEFKVRDHS